MNLNNFQLNNIFIAELRYFLDFNKLITVLFIQAFVYFVICRIVLINKSQNISSVNLHSYFHLLT